MKRATTARMCATLLTLAASLSALATKTVVRGVAPDYATMSIVASCKADYVSGLKKDLGTAEVEADGSFSIEMDIDETTYAYLDLSTVHATIYLEPGATYGVELPAKQLRDDADRFNPFYQPEVRALKIVEGPNELNAAIASYEAFFRKAFTKMATRLVQRHDKGLAKSLIAMSDSVRRATHCNIKFFADHVKYREAQIYAAPRLDARRAVLSRYYTNSAVLFNVPAYWQTLEMLAPDIFTNSTLGPVGKTMRKHLASSAPSVSELTNIAQQDTLWGRNKDLCETLIVKAVYDNYYARSLSLMKTDSLLMSAAAECHNKNSRMMAANIYAQKNKLRAGLPAPDINVLDANDRELHLQDFSGRFLYICFMHTDNYECLKAMPALENLSQLHKPDMDVLCIFTNEKPEEAYNYVKNNRFSWMAASFITNQKIIFDYEVHALPTYFLIAPDGTIAMAQAPGPTEKVGPAIAAAIREYILSTKRGRIEMPRTIYDIANESKAVK